MQISKTIADFRAARRNAAGPVGFVPTLGALHEGHESLLVRARRECATLYASVFVNPLQFGEPKDFERYPRTLEADAALLRGAGCDGLFAPEAGAFYPEGFSTTVDVGKLGTILEGASRPGHFAGVCTVVLKLLHVVEPDFAYFGRKDAQQIAVLKRMTRDLDCKTRIVVCETVREEDGLALSSRNRFLDPEQRRRALGLSRGLFRARAAWERGERDFAELERIAREPGLAYDYVACVDEETFSAPRRGKPGLIAAAARLGSVRLIDSVSLEPAPKT